MNRASRWARAFSNGAGVVAVVVLIHLSWFVLAISIVFGLVACGVLAGQIAELARPFVRSAMVDVVLACGFVVCAACFLAGMVRSWQFVTAHLRGEDVPRPAKPGARRAEPLQDHEIRKTGPSAEEIEKRGRPH